jgi:prepilin-type processing-associated H-X9-DG protein
VQILVFVPLGWIWFLGRVIADVRLDAWGLATAIVCLVFLAFGLHFFCGWLAHQIEKKRNAAEALPRPWTWRRTLTICSVMLLMFVSGIAVVGMTHQSVWLVTSPEPLLTSSFGRLVERLETENSLKQMALAMHTNHDVHKRLPAGALFDSNGKALHGWQTAILPWIEQEGLYKRIDLKLPWNDAVNAAHFKQEIVIYQYPGARPAFNEQGYALSHFSSNVRVIGGNVSLTLEDIKDGAGQTLLIGQIAENYPAWGYPLNWRDPALGLNQSAQGFGNPDKTGAIFAFADGHVKFLKNNVNPEVLKALSTPAGGEQILIED